MAKNKTRDSQIEAIDRSMPKIIDVEDKVTLTSSKLKNIKEWVVGEDYEITMKITQLASRELMNGEIEAEFEIKEVKAV